MKKIIVYSIALCILFLSGCMSFAVQPTPKNSTYINTYTVTYQNDKNELTTKEIKTTYELNFSRFADNKIVFWTSDQKEVMQFHYRKNSQFQITFDTSLFVGKMDITVK